MQGPQSQSEHLEFGSSAPMRGREHRQAVPVATPMGVIEVTGWPSAPGCPGPVATFPQSALDRRASSRAWWSPGTGMIPATNFGPVLAPWPNTPGPLLRRRMGRGGGGLCQELVGLGSPGHLFPQDHCPAGKRVNLVNPTAAVPASGGVGRRVPVSKLTRLGSEAVPGSVQRSERWLGPNSRLPLRGR